MVDLKTCFGDYVIVILPQGKDLCYSSLMRYLPKWFRSVKNLCASELEGTLEINLNSTLYQ